MNIFSAVERTDPSPAGHGDSHSQFIDRVAGPFWDQVRDLIEDWFSQLCSDAQADVRGRLRSRNDRQSKGAFFELYLHECLLRMGYTVTCHPEIDGTSHRSDGNPVALAGWIDDWAGVVLFHAKHRAMPFATYDHFQQDRGGTRPRLDPRSCRAFKVDRGCGK
ncbi:hypothetical protein ACFV1N_25030 [Streptosporangium canum]|uniref:hypothetical protein n=1 Tax=Streptosporangium canum TaxID=324952 RepID=UPI003697311A